VSQISIEIGIGSAQFGQFFCVGRGLAPNSFSARRLFAKALSAAYDLKNAPTGFLASQTAAKMRINADK